MVLQGHLPEGVKPQMVHQLHPEEEDENFASLPKELQQKYEEKFRQPEAFLKMGSKIMAIPTEPAKAAGKGKTAPVTER